MLHLFTFNLFRVAVQEQKKVQKNKHFEKKQLLCWNTLDTSSHYENMALKSPTTVKHHCNHTEMVKNKNKKHQKQNTEICHLFIQQCYSPLIITQKLTEEFQ